MDYISRDELRKHLADCMTADFFDSDMKKAVVGIDVYVENMPAADVQPVKHGCWEEVTDYGGWGDTNYRCSVCDEEWYLEDCKPNDNNMNFCPRCGARMDLNGRVWI